MIGELRSAAIDLYWNLVNRFNRLAYLHHVAETESDSEDFDIETYEEILAIETRIWVERGNKVHVGVTDILDPGYNPHEIWLQSPTGTYVEYTTLRKFKKLVEDAEYGRSKRKREGRESWIKWITAGAAIIAALGTLLSLYWTSHGKKP